MRARSGSEKRAFALSRPEKPSARRDPGAVGTGPRPNGDSEEQPESPAAPPRAYISRSRAKARRRERARATRYGKRPLRLSGRLDGGVYRSPESVRAIEIDAHITVGSWIICASIYAHITGAICACSD